MRDDRQGRPAGPREERNETAASERAVLAGELAHRLTNQLFALEALVRVAAAEPALEPSLREDLAAAADVAAEASRLVRELAALAG